MVFDRFRQEGGVVVQSFTTESDAEAAVRALQQAGFTSEQISIVARDEGRADQVAGDTGTETAEGAAIGAVTGWTLGGLAGMAAVLAGASSLAIPGIGLVIGGPLAVTLAGAGAGATVGGLAGALSGMGISEDEARGYRERFEAGDILVVVTAGAREAEVRQILYGGTTYDDTGNSTTSTVV